MRRALHAVVLLAAVSGCLRTHFERRSVPVDTGLPLSFGEEGGAVLSWDFGDGSPRVEAAHVERAFTRGGHYVVRATAGEQLVWQIELDAMPRPVTRAVPAAAEWAVFAPQVKGDFNGSLDFFERVLGPGNLQSVLDGTLLAALAIDSTAMGALVDPLKGFGAFRLGGLDATVVLLGVQDERAAMDELDARLHGTDLGQGARGFETKEGARALVFADRGYLYAVFPHDPQVAAQVMQAVRAADARGLELNAAYRSLPAGQTGRVVMLAAPLQKAQLPIDALWATVNVSGNRAQLEGRLFSKDLLWQTQGQPSATALLSRAWEGPVLAASLRLPPGLLRSMLEKGSPEREASRQRLLSHGIDIERMVKALTGDVGALMWFDAEAFLRNLIEGSERPEPRGAALVEVQLSDGKAWESAVGQMLEVFLPVRPKLQQRSDGSVWSTRLAGQDAQLTVAAKSMRVELGSGLRGRTLVDLSALLGQRFDGAFGKGHASLLFDVGRLKAELETPRMIEGLDPMKVVTVQGFASAFLDRYTAIDHVLLDLAPLPDGAALKGRIVLKEKEH
ncbi:MAG: hypothetical protein IPJ65_24535 [Archangiaceae bacterium]|nr:hypothetical protein [Archangiaceae bacterium]